ncbi:hypothetical protein ACFZBM_24360 [Streptomyces lavendulae]|uniref:Uncharacterized protein n=1 Tax=Streptomyces lavendulae subsp. lavendulae TaxID=58340 RepID=A0A2K8PJD2_STRLA|nr:MULTISPECIES: hypothetical protein [Streptomyces]ATZ26220.1 hypothetical protein SLAV_22020 [Streptomyces lavendulae subsp. lavendulae]MDH6541868.1 hypothetical protein [Streptomyces sp. SPB4]QUQ56049.1 hypothetical protein SLLC_20135 [Streptomyces lavendulae subsp. lavendulae]GLW02266.1 hypothetical protein Slala05_58960 [Streptomyces lavendulae subsp. lavendulae]
MKLSQVAAVVVGSVAALGAAAPAFAADAPASMPPMSATGGLTEVLNAAGPVTESLPQTVGNGLAEQGQTVDKAVGTVQKVNTIRNNAPGEVLGLANGATQASPLLGGVKLNGGQ